MSLSELETIVAKANEALRTGHYEAVCDLCTFAIALNTKRLPNATIQNGSTSKKPQSPLEITRTQKLQQKLYLTRARARNSLGDGVGTRHDLDAFVACGGQESLVKLVETESLPVKISNADEVDSKLPSQSVAFEVKPTTATGKGVFATPRSTLQATYEARENAVKALAPRDLVKFLELTNAFDDVPLFTGIYRTNTLPDGLGFHASHFNHCCNPNARYSYHPDTGRLRVFALTHIPVGAEIFVMYIQGRNIYGSTRAVRQERFRTNFNFTCVCSVCKLEGDALMASDKRRTEAGLLYDGMMRHDPWRSGGLVIRDAIRAITLLREEGYHADVDDFATDAGGLCAMHSDWESALWWARLGYETRQAEFGTDHPHAKKVKIYVDDPRSYPQAGVFSSGKRFMQRV
ncbi:SET domain-containing protein [Mycena indigotica]|uniref:SET domain-containing protein n=1 Tax=Mycena indigotica TaxID=2126181 RepID=A0A8H6W0P8_9AGAR|nr:SET domain-containing protein [Mycena indigotica]KAF7297303.1 SET domain-containing protein [Mycena indigotica]